MKKYIHLSLMMALAFMFTLSFTACNDDDDDKLPAKPSVALTEVGHDNSRKAHPGHDLHLEGNVLAEGLIKSINVEIHQEGGKFEIEKAYTTGKYIGVRNCEFHEHIDIPADAPLGEYHLHFTVTDQKGQQIMTEQHVQIVEHDGDEEEEEEHHHH